MKMKIGKRYIVTKASKCKTFLKGDHIMLNKDGAISCKEAQGWIEAADVAEAVKGMECKLDHDWVARRKAKLQAELDALCN